MQHSKIITLFGVFTLSTVGCALFGSIAPAAAKRAKIKLVNETPGTELCLLTVGHPTHNNYEEQPLDLGPGESVELETPLSSPDGAEVCVKICHSELGKVFAGCVRVLLNTEKVETLALVEGKENRPPNWDPKRHRLDIQAHDFPAWRREDDTLAMYNLTDVNFLGWTGGAKDPWGEFLPDKYDITVENPDCKSEVSFAFEDNKGLIMQRSVDVEHTERFFGEDTPIYMILEPTGKRHVYIWDLPEGIYVFRVNKNCKSIDLVSEEHPEGVESAKKVSKSHEKNKR